VHPSGELFEENRDARRSNACNDSCDLRFDETERKWSRDRGSGIWASDERSTRVSALQRINRSWRGTRL